MAPNANGYTVLVMSYNSIDGPETAWRLSVISSKPLKSWAEQPAARMEAYEGEWWQLLRWNLCCMSSMLAAFFKGRSTDLCLFVVVAYAVSTHHKLCQAWT